MLMCMCLCDVCVCVCVCVCTGIVYVCIMCVCLCLGVCVSQREPCTVSSAVSTHSSATHNLIAGWTTPELRTGVVWL